MANDTPVPRIGRTLVPVIGRARVYVCGITPYETTHLGHAATFVWADTAARVLRLTGSAVDLCRNITDVDDVLYRQAERERTSWRSLATQQTYRFEADMAALGVSRPALRTPCTGLRGRCDRSGHGAPGDRSCLRPGRDGVVQG